MDKLIECKGCMKLLPVRRFSPSSITSGYMKCGRCASPKRVNKPGYLYILGNKAWSGWYKVGLTTTPADKKLGAINVYSPFRDFEILLMIPVPDVFVYEKEAHWALEEIGIVKQYEWFNADVQTITEVLVRVVNTEFDYE